MSETLAPTTPRLELRVDESLEAEAWDRFLERIPSGHHTQTSKWARVKATMGWRPLRVMAVRDDVIIAGAQLLVRRVPGLGAIGYIANGPAAAPTEEAAAEVVLDEVERVVRHRRIRHVTI